MHHQLTETTAEVPYPSDSLFVQDGAALFHSITALPPSFGDICLLVVDQMLAMKDFLFSTKLYLADYIKVTELLRRGSYDRLV